MKPLPIILVVTLLTITSSIALAQHWGPQNHPRQGNMDEPGLAERGPDIETIATQIGLDDDTKAKLKEIKRQTRNELMEARFEVKKAKVALRDLLEEDSPNESAIMRQIEDIGQLEVEVRKLKIRSLLEARELLTPEQRVAFKKLRRTQKEHRREKRKNRKMKHRF